MILTRTKLPDRFYNESVFRNWLMGFAEGLGHHVSWVESHETSAGIPDLNIGVRGVDTWLELKVVYRDAMGRGSVKMRPPQRRWHSERYAAGGSSWVLVCDRETMTFWLVPGHLAAQLAPKWDVWQAAAMQVPMLPPFFTQLRELTLYGISESHSKRAEGISGEATSPLPPSSEDVGSHHWLTDKP